MESDPEDIDDDISDPENDKKPEIQLIPTPLLSENL